MGYSVTPTFRVQFSCVTSGGVRVAFTPQGWDVKRAGRPTPANLAEFVRGLEDSTAAGGCNEHLGETHIGGALVVRQSNDEVVAEYAAPLFQVVSGSLA